MKFFHTITIRESKNVAGKYLYSDVGTSPAFVQPMDSQLSQLYGLTMGKGFTCYVPLETSVSESNRVLYNGKTFGVRGLKEHSYGSLAHKRLDLELL